MGASLVMRRAGTLFPAIWFEYGKQKGKRVLLRNLDIESSTSNLKAQTVKQGLGGLWLEGPLKVALPERVEGVSFDGLIHKPRYFERGFGVSL